MGGLRWQEVYSACPTVVGWVFSSLCANVMSIVQESNITSKSLSKRAVAKVSIRVCNICKGWDGLTGNVLRRCPPCSCLCAMADVQERKRQKQKFQEQKLQKKIN